MCVCVFCTVCTVLLGMFQGGGVQFWTGGDVWNAEVRVSLSDWVKKKKCPPSFLILSGPVQALGRLKVKLTSVSNLWRAFKENTQSLNLSFSSPSLHQETLTSLTHSDPVLLKQIITKNYNMSKVRYTFHIKYHELILFLRHLFSSFSISVLSARLEKWSTRSERHRGHTLHTGNINYLQ